MHALVIIHNTIAIIFILGLSIFMAHTIHLRRRNRRRQQLPCGHHTYGWSGEVLIHPDKTTTPIITCTSCSHIHTLPLDNQP